MADTVRLIVTASQDWDEPVTIWQALLECHQWARSQRKNLVIVHGNARGGDQICSLYAQLNCINEPHPAGWEAPCRGRCRPGHRRRRRNGREYCPAAGDYRNEEMVAAGADRGAAFIKARSPGASHCARTMENAGIPVRRYEIS